jgi:hypothetical protein
MYLSWPVILPRTRVSLTQGNNLTAEDCDHSRKNWEVMLADLKKVVESDIIQGTLCRIRRGLRRA